MGYRKVPRIYTLEFDGDLEGLVVKAKAIKFGKVRRLLSIMGDDTQETEAMQEIVTTLTEALLAWNMEDEQGVEIPLNEAGIDDLEYPEVIAITNKWLDAITGPSEELGKGSSSGETSLARSLTMEAL